MKALMVASLFVMVDVIASPARADVIGSWIRSTPTVVGDNEPCATVTLLPLNNAGNTSRTFVTTRDSQRVVATFSAECSVKAPNTVTWLNIDILVDGIDAPPIATSDNAFCTGHGNNVLDGWVSASTTAVILVQEPGLHSIQVRANLIGCSDISPRDDQWRLDDHSLVLLTN